MFRRMGMGTVKVKPAESLANRLKKLEEALDDLRFESKAALEQINPHVIRNRFETLESNITRIKSHTATLASADDVDDSRRTLELMRQEIVSQVETSMKAQQEELDTIQDEQKKETLDSEKAQKMCAFQLRALHEDLKDASQSPQTKMTKIGSALTNAAYVIQAACNDISGETVAPSTLGRALEQSGWALHFLLKKDDETERELEQIVADGAESDVKRTRLLCRLKDIQCRSGYYELRDKCDSARKVTMEAMFYCTNAAKTFLDVKWLEHMHESTANQDQLQLLRDSIELMLDSKVGVTEFEEMPQKLLRQEEWLEQIHENGEKYRAAKEAENQVEEEEEKKRGQQQLTSEVQQMGMELSTLSSQFERVKDSLEDKADSDTVHKHIGAVSNAMQKLTEKFLVKSDLDQALRGKLDKKDVHSIATALAGDPKAIEQDAAIFAKLQVPNFRCLGCNRPMRSLGASQETPPMVGVREFPEHSVSLNGVKLQSDMVGPPPRSANALPGKQSKFSHKKALPASKANSTSAWNASSAQDAAATDGLVEDGPSVSRHKRVIPHSVKRSSSGVLNGEIDSSSSQAQSQSRPNTAGM